MAKLLNYLSNNNSNKNTDCLAKEIFNSVNMAEAHTCITEERLKILIKSILAEEFQKQEKHITNIISGNFEIVTKEIKDLKAEVRDLKDSLKFTENVIEKKVENLETELDDLEGKVQKIWDY